MTHGDIQIIRNIVNRSHVGEDYLSVVRIVISELKDGYEGFSSLPKGLRRGIIRHAILAHRYNKKMVETFRL